MTQQEQPGLSYLAPHPRLEELISVLAQLRAPGGCAWDGEQTHESLVRYLVEETYELIDAIEGGNREEMIEELGDVLYQVIFHSDIAAHTPGEEFTIEDVAAHMTAKMIGRHPHVFGDTTAETADDVMAVWDELKRVEKPTRTSTLDGVPQGMPALALADKLLGKAAKLGLTVAAGPVADSVAGDELLGTEVLGTELLGAESGGSSTADLPRNATVRDFRDEEELGVFLLSVVASARANGLDAERALRSRLRSFQDEMREAENPG